MYVNTYVIKNNRVHEILQKYANMLHKTAFRDRM